MLNCSQSILNEIARSNKMHSIWNKSLFLASSSIADNELDRKWCELVGFLEKENINFSCSNTTMAGLILEALILWQEHKAITKYIMKTGRLSLRNVLPEILSPDDAVELICRERNYMLNNQDKALTKEILEKLYNQ